MAGSYNHIAPSGNDPGGWSLIENMGDAHECVEELLWLVFHFAKLTLQAGGQEFPTLSDLDLAVRSELDTTYYPMRRGEEPKDEIFQEVQRIMEL